MADMVFDVQAVTPQKRDHHEMVDDSASLPVVEHTNVSSVTTPSNRELSPAPSTISSLTELTSHVASPGTLQNQIPISTAAEPAVKKRKLTFIEKEMEKAAKQREKEEKLRAKEEEKARREEERKARDEEKRKTAEEKETVKRAKEIEKAEKQKSKDAEKEAKQKEKDAKKHEKDIEKARTEAEKLKKERAQMRIGAFFGKPAPQATPPSTPDDVSEGVVSRRSSIVSIDMEKPMLEAKTPSKASTTEFDKWILPFFVPEYTDLAPYNRYRLGRSLDFVLDAQDNGITPTLAKQFGRPRKRMKRPISVKQIVHKLQDVLTQPSDTTREDVVELAAIPYKHLQYHEDVRPPYQGTFTRMLSPRTANRVSRNPFRRELPETNYDVDSEAEWEPPAPDDEELNDEDEMSDADGDEDEMADFLDDADDLGRRKGPLTDMEPISSGLCWAGERFDDNGHNIEQYRMDVLHDAVTFPIDPYAPMHWSDEAKLKPPSAKPQLSNTLPPQRHPLANLTPNAIPQPRALPTLDGKVVSKARGPAPNPGKELKLIDAEYLAAFKEAVRGSDLTKAGLIEILKKQFPKCSKDAIKDTLGVVAVRVGKKEAEKKWELLDGA